MTNWVRRRPGRGTSPSASVVMLSRLKVPAELLLLLLLAPLPLRPYRSRSIDKRGCSGGAAEPINSAPGSTAGSHSSCCTGLTAGCTACRSACMQVGVRLQFEHVMFAP